MDEKTPLLPRADSESVQVTETPPHRLRRRNIKTKMFLVLSALGILSALIILRAYLYPLPTRLFTRHTTTVSIATDSSTTDTDTDLSTTKHHPHHHKAPITQLSHLPTHLLPTPHNNRRLLLVGDVHGSPHSLKHLLHKTHFNTQTDHLILTGDIINKGPNTHGAVKLARDLGASCVRGNHEDKCLGLRGLGVSNQSVEAKVDVSACTRDLSKKDLAYLSSCPLILSLGKLAALPHAKEVVVVHAGLVPGIKLEDQDPFAVMNMRAISRGKHRREKKKGKGKFVPEEGRNDGTPWFKVWGREQELLEGPIRVEGGAVGDASELEYEKNEARVGEEGEEDEEDEENDVASNEHGVQPTVVIYGHDSKTGLNIRKWSKGLDSGCVNGDRLSGLLIDAEKTEVVSVKCKENR